MTSIRKVALACMTAAMVTVSVNAGAQGPRNQDTYFTFSQAVELPKTTLPAGTYFFQLMDSDSNRHIVKVMSQDRKQLHATLLAIPFYTNDRPSDEPQVRFMETPATASAAATNAIKVWFYPGNSVGHEFIYPRAQALQIAARTGNSVLTTKSDTEATDTVADAELTHVDRNGADEANAQPAPAREPVGAITGNPTPERTPEPAVTPERAPEPETTSARAPEPAPAATRTAEPAPRTDLPATAGPLPLLALIGLGSLAGSRLLRKAQQ